MSAIAQQKTEYIELFGCFFEGMQTSTLTGELTLKAFIDAYKLTFGKSEQIVINIEETV